MKLTSQMIPEARISMRVRITDRRTGEVKKFQFGDAEAEPVHQPEGDKHANPIDSGS